MDRVMLVYDIDGISLGRELYVNSAATIVRWKNSRIPLRIRGFLLFGIGSAVSVLQRIDAHVFETSTISAFLVEGLALIVLEAIDGLENIDE
jgi:hypothetical protein